MARLRSFASLDPRSLVCLRVGTAVVLAWDMLRALYVADDWWAMQGYGEPKLPAWLMLGSEAMTLRLAASAVVVVSILLALGWRARPLTLAAWASACAFQYAARGTADYHNAVLWCAVERCTSSVGEIPTRYLSFQPVATGAVVEATKLLKPLVERVV
jgi:hypothetical protein